MTTEVAFADALRGWRARRGVSQLELALRARTTQRHLSFIENGRSVPGRGMVIRLAEALEIPLRHRNHLLLSAGYAPAYDERRLDDPGLDPVRSALDRVLAGHEPYPAALTDRDANLVSANAGFARLVEGVSPELLAAPASLPRLLLHPDGLAPRILNLDEWGWHVVDAVIAPPAATPTTLEASRRVARSAAQTCAAGLRRRRRRRRRRAAPAHDPGPLRHGHRRGPLGADARGLPARGRETAERLRR